MNKQLKFVILGIIPAIALVAGATWYKKTSERSIEYQKNFQSLKIACQDSAQPTVEKGIHVSEHVESVCTCFAKSALKHRSISVASVVGDTDMVHAILKDCSQRYLSSK